MNVTLEVISANGSGLGAARRKVFGAEGGRIGRAADCDWVLPSPDRFVSRYHAIIECKYGQFYVKSNSENGVGINSPTAFAAFDKPTLIKQGDRIYIDEYEILVSARDEVRAPLIMGDPFADDADDAQSDSLIPAVDSSDLGDLDPLKKLAPDASDGYPSRQTFRGAPPGDVLSEHFAPPPPRGTRGSPPPRTPAASRIEPSLSIPTDPDAWNKTGYGMPGPQQTVPPRSFTPTVRQPERPQVTPPTPPVPKPAATAPVPRRPERMVNSGPLNGADLISPLPQRVPQPQQLSNQAAAPRRSTLPAPPQAGPSSALSIEDLLIAAGVDPQSVPEDTAAILGRILSVVVQGTIDAMRAREEVKSQFRLAVTRVRDRENNPLSFALSASDALNALLNRQKPGYLPPVEAFERAFDDIRNHQIAMLAGVRAGFESLMNRFDPQLLQEDFDKHVKRAGMLGVGKPKYWDMYTDYFTKLRGDRELAFRRLFGDEFGRAYEKQVEQIKINRSGKKP